MTDKPFKPMLAPNELPDLDDLKYPLLASMKLDGIRCIIKDGQLLSRSLKPIPNRRIWEMLKPEIDRCKSANIILDGELYSHDITFQEITSVVMSKDKEVPESLKYYVFDQLFHMNIDENFCSRTLLAKEQVYTSFNCERLAYVRQHEVYDADDTLDFAAKAYKHGYEGLILRDPEGRYKFGRGTLKEGLIYKVKPYIDKSAIIKGWVQATVAREGSEKKINELGGSVTSRKKADRVPVDKIAAFVVDWHGKDLKVTVAATDTEKKQMWQDREKYLGCEINFKAMDVGAKDLPRHPVMTKVWKVDE